MERQRRLRNPDHAVHIALREAESVMVDMQSIDEHAPGAVEEALGYLGGLFLAGLEFGLRYSARYPELVAEGIAWVDSIPDGEPLEIRERNMQEDARMMLEGCE